MKGVVSLLDDYHSDLVADLWQQFDREFDLREVYEFPCPHLPLHLAEDYDFASLDMVMRRMARTTAPFTVRTAGIAVQMEEPLKVDVSVVRGFDLFQFHQKLWYELAPAVTQADHRYHPDYWVPGIPLATGDVQQSLLPNLMWVLSHEQFNWEFTIDNLCYIEDPGYREARPLLQLELTGEPVYAINHW